MVVDIDFGTILKITGLTSDVEDEVDTVMLVNNTTDGSFYNCKVLDLSNYELITDFESIEEFLNDKKIKIVEIIGKKKLV